MRNLSLQLIVIISLLFCYQIAWSQCKTGLRVNLNLFAKDEKLSKDWLNYLQSKSDATIEETAYVGFLTGLQANFQSSIFEKGNSLKKCKSILNNCINNHPNNLEARFLRFSIESKIPKILFESENIGEDKRFIINNIANWKEDDCFKIKIIDFLVDSRELFKNEKAYLTSLKKNML